MIRMSLDKETVLPRDGRGDTAVPEGPASGGGGGVDRVGGVMMSPHPTCLGPTGFTGSVVLTEQPHPHGAKPRSTHPLKTKNGLQHPPNNPQALPPGQQQRMGKRRYSLGGSFKHPGFGKRRRRANSDSQSDPVLPSNFLLGGNIFDPLNLNSLLDEEVSRALNAETPKSSPLPARARDPVEILVPRDITDPLNLKSGAGEGEEGGGVLVSPMKNRKRHRNRHHGGGGGGGAQPEPPTHAEGSKVEAGGDSGAGGEVLVLASVPLFPASVSGALDAVPEASREGSVVPQSPLPYELNTTINCRDEVVPPILPRRHTHPPLGSASKPRLHGDGGHRQRKRRRTTSTRSDHSSVTPTPALATAPPNTFHTPLVPGSGLRGQRSGSAVGGQQQPQNSFRHKPQKKKNRFQHGNYSRYYGYHGYYGYRDGQVGQFEDPRLGLLRPDWFRGKTVLDIGCSTGHLTLAIARHFSPAHILGIDVDGWLVHTARQNIRHFLSERLTQDARAREEGRGETERERWGDRESKQKTETAEQSGRRTQSRTKMASGTAEKKMEEEGQKEECRSGTAEKKMEEEGQKEECRSGTAEKKMEEEGQKEECRSGTAEKKMEEEGQKEECRSGTAEKKMEEEGQKEECRSGTAVKKMEEEGQKEECRSGTAEKKMEEECKSGTAEKKMEEECRSGTAEKKMEEECRSGTAEKKMEEECRSGTAEKKMEEECSALEDLKRTLSLLSPGSGPRGAGRPLPPFPLSFRVCRGPIAAPPLPPPSPLAHGTPGIFPNNVSFITGDYMEDREPRPHGDDVTAGYDVILCLGVTKWVQLHSGDGGVVRMFRRIYTHLRPGGMLLLEPQPWSSYCCSKNTTETTYRNYCDIRLRPDNFCCYLTSTVGFTCYRLLTDTGFQRPIYLFHKGPAPRK